jgi:hypothetical protein
MMLTSWSLDRCVGVTMCARHTILITNHFNSCTETDGMTWLFFHLGTAWHAHCTVPLFSPRAHHGSPQVARKRYLSQFFAIFVISVLYHVVEREMENNFVAPLALLADSCRNLLDIGIRILVDN